MTDDRPRPRYGEYATPDEQASALGIPLHPPLQPPPPDVADRVAPTLERPRPIRPARTLDLFFTIALLTFGLLSVLGGVVQNRGLGAQLDAMFDQFGIGSYTNLALAATIGLWLTISQIVVFVMTALLSVLAVRKHRVAFYIPILGAVVYFIVAVILVSVALGGDPAFAHYLDTMAGPAN
jgi:hypothetical protein